MDNFSIELASERIFDPRTRHYFSEVLSSYINGNYRSAVVMLWSVVVCDLVYKLQHLRDVYNDQTADTILDGLQKRQIDNPSNPDWELNLLNEVRQRTELIDNSEYESLVYLQNRRHLSAHPVLTGTDLLFSPNKETVRALIRNSLESVLLKPPLLSRKISTELVIDLAQKKDLFPDDASLKRYLEAKYLKNLLSAIENNLFRTLWKFVFRTSNPDTDENRTINYRTLKIIFSRRPNDVRGYIKDYQDFFSEVGNQDQQLEYLVEFLSENPAVFEYLTDAARAPIQTFVNRNLGSFATATFLSTDVKSHFEEIKRLVNEEEYFTTYSDGHQKIISEEAWIRILDLATDGNCVPLVLDIAVEIHIKSGNYDFADLSFSRFIQPSLESFTKAQLTKLIEGIDSNHQTYDRRRAKTDYKILYKKCQQILGPDFDYSAYSNFYKLVRTEKITEEKIPF